MSAADPTPIPAGPPTDDARPAGEAGASGASPAAIVPAAIDSVAALVAAREARGLAAADVVAALKLSPRQVAALETGDWSSLPGLAFTRAALRSYGRLIGVSVEPLAAAIGQGVAAPELREAASLRAPMPRTGLLGFGAGGSGSRLAWLVLAVVLLIVMGLFFGREAAREADPTTVAPVAPPAPAAPAAPGTSSASGAEPAASAPAADATPSSAPAPGSAAGSAPSGSTPAAPAPASTSTSTAPVTPAPGSTPAATATAATAAPAAAFPMLTPSAREAVLRFDRDAWVEIRRADGQSLVEGLQRAGTELRLPLNGELALVVGNAEFVRIERGGVPVDLRPLIRQGVARLKLAP